MMLITFERKSSATLLADDIISRLKNLAANKVADYF
jgi:hypothetical protein